MIILKLIRASQPVRRKRKSLSGSRLAAFTRDMEGGAHFEGPVDLP